MDQQKLRAAFAAFDRANTADPRRDGLHPYELRYARRMTETLDAYRPDAPVALRLAARAQHLERWKSPREDYPLTREGYLRWRTDLKKYHARRAGEILAEVGYGKETIERVGFLLEKKRLKRDPDTQTLEDVICLVFLEHYARDFADEHPEEKVISILHKTATKMSERGLETVGLLNLGPRVRALLKKALSE